MNNHEIWHQCECGEEYDIRQNIICPGCVNKYRMKILIACEESQAVCIAFRNKGHEAYSCDIQECSGEHPEWHIQDDVLNVIENGRYDMMIGHPVCKYLSHAGNGHFDFFKYGNRAIDRWHKRVSAADFFMKLWNANIEKICLENPVGWINSFLPPSQVINPSFFGEPENKRTCLWLKNLPNLNHYKDHSLFGEKTHVAVRPTYIDKNGKPRYFTESISGYRRDAEKLRSKTFPCIAQAMADQWG